MLLRWLFRHKYAPSKSASSSGPSSNRSSDKHKGGSLLQQLAQALDNSTDAIIHSFRIQQTIHCTLIYMESIVDIPVLQKLVMEKLIGHETSRNGSQLDEAIKSGACFTMKFETSRDPEHILENIMQGKAALLLDGQPDVFLLNVAKYTHRAVTEAQNEMVIIGPQEAFIENIDTNLSLIRHKVKHPNLKSRLIVLGEFTKTRVILTYIDGLCDPQLLEELDTKIRGIQRDSILGSSYISENLDPNPYSPFPLIQFTERPDSMAASLLEGRIGIMVDGTPQSLIVPVTFFSLMQSPEDYFQSFLASSWIRWTRYFFLIVSFLMPSMYVAITTFHPEMIPPTLLISIAASRENIPFPALAEVIAMELTFEGLREAGIRIPRPLGQTVSILGAIVIGQSAVQAGIVSAPTVIIVSITGIASFIIPHFELGLAFRLLRFPLILIGGTLGFYGIILGLFLIFTHLVTLNSFGVPYMKPVAPLVIADWKDVFIRAPWSKMSNRPEMYKTSTSQSKGKRNE